MRETTSNYEGGFPGGTVVKNPPANAGDIRDTASNPGVKKIPWRRERLHIPIFWPREFPMDCIVHGVAKSRIQLSDFHFFPGTS